MQRIIVLGTGVAAALTLAACGSSTTVTPASGPSSATASATSAAPSAAAAPPGGKDRIAGAVASVSGSTITVNEQNGPAAVGFTSSTRISALAHAQLTDVTSGSCVSVQPTKDSAGANNPTARAVTISAANNEKCAQPYRGRGVAGVVSAVNGDTVVVAEAGTQSTNVTVTGSTRFLKRTPADAAAITAGVCVTARGTTDGAGTLQASAITVRSADSGKCKPGR